MAGHFAFGMPYLMSRAATISKLCGWRYDTARRIYAGVGQAKMRGDAEKQSSMFV